MEVQCCGASWSVVCILCFVVTEISRMRCMGFVQWNPLKTSLCNKFACMCVCAYTYRCVKFISLINRMPILCLWAWQLYHVTILPSAGIWALHYCSMKAVSWTNLTSWPVQAPYTVTALWQVSCCNILKWTCRIIVQCLLHNKYDPCALLRPVTWCCTMFIFRTICSTEIFVWRECWVLEFE